jgi:succinate-semialdehyde dehydrogenase/glutarate-semialdehyde dehydrogenase
MTMKSINPATGEIIKEFEELTGDQAAGIVDKAHQAFTGWSGTDAEERATLMKNTAEILRENARKYGELMSTEMGKPLESAVAEVKKCALVCDYYVDKAETFLEPEYVKTEATRSYVCFCPLGVVLAIMPWNFPFWQVFRFAAPALMAGNACVLKHASNVPSCALEIEEIFIKAGFPEHLFSTLLVGRGEVDRLIENPLIRAVTLTGSLEAGKAVAAKAGQQVKKTVMELGGSDPYVVLHDADLENAAETCTTSRLINTGQSCIAAKRFIVVRNVRERFQELVYNIMKAKKMGDPLSSDIDIGPMAREDLRDQLHHQVKQSVKQGAKCLLGGEIPAGPGAFYPPTILTGVKTGMPAFDQELFGPVAVIIEAADEKEAISLANNSTFGLGAAVFTQDLERGERIARRELDAGSCFVNQFVRSDPRLPFGGIKESGYGRELSHFGIKEFVNIKTVYVE